MLSYCSGSHMMMVSRVVHACEAGIERAGINECMRCQGAWCNNYRLLINSRKVCLLYLLRDCMHGSACLHGVALRRARRVVHVPVSAVYCHTCLEWCIASDTCLGAVMVLPGACVHEYQQNAAASVDVVTHLKASRTCYLC